MNKTINKDNLFKPAPTRPVSKADATDRAARAIIDADAASRREKTARLRAARLAADETRK